jgi:SAM-dependent methyltransferase
MKNTETKTVKPNYGQDMPGIIFSALFLSVLFGILAIWQFRELYYYNKATALAMAVTFTMLCVLSLSMAVTGIWCSRYGKLRLRDKTLNLLDFKGNENILDLGCGKGLLLIEAAKKLHFGKATGADIWDHNLEYNSSAQIVMENAKLEKVADRVEVFTADAQQMPFNDNTYDFLMTSLMMHHVKDSRKAINEMIRVTKPGGKIVIADVNSKRYSTMFQQLGLTKVEMHYGTRLFFVPAHIIIGEKPQLN